MDGSVSPERQRDLRSMTTAELRALFLRHRMGGKKLSTSERAFIRDIAAERLEDDGDDADAGELLLEA